MRAGTPGPKAIGVDEISIRFGGDDRSEASMAQFYNLPGSDRSRPGV